jgi:Zn-dependent M28 family amino/carboxypeptidase
MYPDLTINLDSLRETVEFLAGLSPPRNCRNIESMERAADYVRRAFEGFGIKTCDQVFPVEGRQYRNVIGTLPGSHASRVIVGAHYDVCGDQPGADDNASAVAGLLECARVVTNLGSRLGHTVEFAAYALEEPPFFSTNQMGSFIHAMSLRNAGVEVRGMMCLESIGYFSEEPNSQEYPAPGMRMIYPSEGDFIAVVGNLSSAGLVQKVKRHMKAAGIKVHSLVAPALVPGVDLSDHRSYWKFGYPAVMITDTALFRNPNYHSETDTPDTLDYAKMGEVVKGLCYAVMNL